MSTISVLFVPTYLSIKKQVLTFTGELGPRSEAREVRVETSCRGFETLSKQTVLVRRLKEHT